MKHRKPHEVFVDRWGHRLRLPASRWRHIEEEHPEVVPHLRRLQEVVETPDRVRESRYDPRVWLYYKFYAGILRGKYILVVARITAEPEILTCYVTDRVKEGRQIWPID